MQSEEMTTTTTNVGGGDEDRVLAAAQQILKSLNAPKEVREDMLLIFSNFDNRLSNITQLINSEDMKNENRYEAAEKVILRWESNSDASRNSLHWEESPDEAAEYLSAVDEVLQLIEDLSLRSDSSEIVARASDTIQVAMARLEEEFRHILIRSTVPLDADRLHVSIRRVSLSFASNYGDIDDEFESFEEVDRDSGRFHERGASLGDDVWVDLIHPDAVVELKEIANRMVRSGYERECVQVYSTIRREVLDECLGILGIEKLSIEEVQKIDWKILDEKMKKWSQAVKIVVRVLFMGEKRLCDYFFDGSDVSKEVCFNETAKGCVMQLLNFGEAVAIGERSPEKLFRILNMYDSLANVLLDLQAMVTDEFVISEAREVLSGLAEASRGTFAVFENAVQGETSKRPMINAEIHPLTRYVMNYVRLLVDYRSILDSLLENGEEELNCIKNENDGNFELECTSPLARRLFSLISCLEANLEEKSKLYGDGAIQYVFLMNNILYIVQKVKDSELRKLLGDNWVRKRRGKIRQLATSYIRASWTKVLSHLNDGAGAGGSSSNALKVALKERLKNFNAGFEEIYRTQSGWKVHDPQLREDLRISVSEKVIPAYRSFMGKFEKQLESGRHAEKYVKYTADDIANYLLDLFEGTPRILHHLRRKST